MQVGTVLAVESRTGMPLRESVLAALAAYGTVEAAAEALRVHPNTLHRWKRQLGITRTYTLPDEVN